VAWLGEPIGALTSASADALAHRLAILGDLEPTRAHALLGELQAALWAESKALERERAIASHVDGQESRVLSTLSFLLERRAKHLAADIETVDGMRSLLSAGSGLKVGEGAVEEGVSPRRSKQGPGGR
jgi:hypothetical protein